jgi:L-fuconolactonase
VPAHIFIDAHVHLIDPTRLHYEWLEDVPALRRAWSFDDYVGVRGTQDLKWFVFVEADVRPEERLTEGRWIAELASRESRLGGMVAAVAVERGLAIEDDIDRLEGTGILSGVRRLIQSEPDPRFCLQPDFLAGLRLLGERDIPFDICCFQHQLGAVAEMVRACPGTRFVLDHLGKPAVRDGALDGWRGALDQVAACPNVSCKISGLATEARHGDWSRAQLLPYVRHAAEAFGDGRVMFGSDWPVSTQAIEYAAWIALLDEAFAGWDEPARNRFWWRTAQELYRLDGL